MISGNVYQHTGENLYYSKILIRRESCLYSGIFYHFDNIEIICTNNLVLILETFKDIYGDIYKILVNNKIGYIRSTSELKNELKEIT